MALQNVSVVPVYVSDQDQAIDFFVNKLGFTKSEDAQFGEGQRWVQVTTPQGPTTIAILKAGEYGMPSNTLGQHTGICFYAEDVRATVEELRSKGVQITDGPSSQGWGVQAQFADPDGNGYVIVGG